MTITVVIPFTPISVRLQVFSLHFSDSYKWQFKQHTDKIDKLLTGLAEF